MQIKGQTDEQTETTRIATYLDRREIKNTTFYSLICWRDTWWATNGHYRWSSAIARLQRLPLQSTHVTRTF